MTSQIHSELTVQRNLGLQCEAVSLRASINRAMAKAVERRVRVWPRFKRSTKRIRWFARSMTFASVNHHTCAYCAYGGFHARKCRALALRNPRMFSVLRGLNPSLGCGPARRSHNQRYNRRRGEPMAERKWRFRSRDGGFEKISPLWLYPEINGSSWVDEAEDQSGVGQLAYFIAWIRRRYPEQWKADAVPIFWSVRGDGVFEIAPNNARDIIGKNFLTVFTPPVDARTGEPLNWWRLPVRNDRFPAFAKALGWLPSPFEEFAPLRSIVTNATQTVWRESRFPEPTKG